ncbi:DNA polymerase III subunit gamma/tau [Dongia rigui]|uniref:DNA polymerase III subunit gamma/tau n=1 Tax=Dongia rigui TaxID=940149 RepID=A0ABU5DXS1_9PROT|nr:DNA polymerase III subunit gamma/tau [Dongia rigui]MDY0872070.1 DNA polymerase III subunit gamma/tau [Dongia rigui]
MSEESGQSSVASGEHYRVLARKYRPSDFSGLVGQDALVRTLTNAIAAGRLAHAFMLTGVRGVGKTTTARILARAFNCVGLDGKGGPTASPCGQCEHCVAIAEDRHVDVIEMDAASRTGVGDMRELIEGVRYRPVSARYKVYIIDEVHMLSNSAFNALLKTLEEPPGHVKFVFATTEIRKVPVTVLSRCQRFDLRRIEADVLAAHFARIVAAENVAVEPNALALVARAADGSARDGLSLLDQAIAMAEGTVTEAQVREMLGLSDRTQLFDLYEAVMGGAAPKALDLLGAMYRAGADPIVVVQDLLDLTHLVTRAKISPEALASPTMPEAEKKRGAELAAKLSMPILARCWQMLLKGLGEAQAAPQALAAVEMALIRLMHVADLPTPGELVKKLSAGQLPAGTPAAPARGGNGAGNGNGTSAIATSYVSGASGGGPTAFAQHGSAARLEVVPQSAPMASPMTTPVVAAAPQGLADPRSFDELVALFRQKKEAILMTHLLSDVHLVHFESGRLDFRPSERAPANLAPRLAQCLLEWTGKRWMVSLSNAAGEATLKQQEAAIVAERKRQAAEHPIVQAILKTFPGATIDEVRDLGGAEPAAPAPAAATEASDAASDDDAIDIDMIFGDDDL